MRYSCRCSFLEIYNETITDLLNPALHNLPIREDQRGTFVENLTEVHVQNGARAVRCRRTRLNATAA